ncbi:MAG: DUF169 domain-containing protein, partial [Candidatus Omnitrophica bacterium]|nr:DUF169 domain-containing protein [Candidatus Omnitrophota bacterium]
MNRTRRNLIGISLHQAVPTAVHKLTTNDKHCHFIGRARQSEPFYIPAENISCPLARFHLGIEKPDLKSLAETLVGWTDAVDQDTGLKFLNLAYRMNQRFKYIAYFAHPENGLKPDVIIRICNPEEIQQIVQRYSSLTGERVNSPISGIGAACGECTAYVLMTGLPVVSVGCNGSRPGINLRDDELLLAAP